jgi:transcriptional regulator with XRE-family HTH domain
MSMRKIHPLRRARFERQLTQEQLAIMAKIPQAKISSYERRLAWPREETQRRLAEALRMPADKLFPEAERR